MGLRQAAVTKIILQAMVVAAEKKVVAAQVMLDSMGYNRDIIIYTDILRYNISADKYVMALDAILKEHESLETYCLANEIINVNRHRIISNPEKVRALILKTAFKPFVFINCKN